MYQEEYSFVAPTAASVYRKVHVAILPLFCFIAAFCYIDRTNLAFASIQLNHDLDFTAQVYGLGSGLFFLGYSLFMVPSNIVMTRVGAPRWLGVLVCLWGLVAASFAGLASPAQFYWLRFLLGAVEAGAFPGMWYYLYLFYPVDYMTVPLAIMEAAVAGANVVSAPLAAGLLLLQGRGGLAGWQWLFLLEGLATVGLGVLTASSLPSSLAGATFLTAAERHWLQQRVEVKDPQKEPLKEPHGGAPLVSGHQGQGGTRAALMEALTNGRVWYVALMGLLKNMASHGILFWAPIINKALLERRDMDPVQLDWTRHRGGEPVAAAAAAAGAVTTQTRALAGAAIAAGAASGNADGGFAAVAARARELAVAVTAGGTVSYNDDGGRGVPGMSITAVLLTGIPFACAAVVSLWLGRRSQAKRERALHLAVPYFVAALMLASLPRLAATAPALGFMAVAVSVACVQGTNSIINSYIPVVASSGPSVPIAMALYNAVANLGGLLGPWLIGELVWRTGGYGDAFRVLGAVMGASAVMAWRTRAWGRTGGLSGSGGSGLGPGVGTDGPQLVGSGVVVRRSLDSEDQVF